jgi:hypothetical protein
VQSAGRNLRLSLLTCEIARTRTKAKSQRTIRSWNQLQPPRTFLKRVCPSPPPKTSQRQKLRRKTANGLISLRSARSGTMTSFSRRLQKRRSRTSLRSKRRQTCLFSRTYGLPTCQKHHQREIKSKQRFKNLERKQQRFFRKRSIKRRNFLRTELTRLSLRSQKRRRSRSNVSQISQQ